jgi:hypothetical protein
MGRLTSLSRFKARYGFKNDQDIVLDTMIASISSQVESYCRHNFLKTTYTEQFPFFEGKRQFPVRGYPIASVTEVAVDFRGMFQGNQTVLNADTYWVQPDAEYQWPRTVFLNLNPNWVVAPMLSANRTASLRTIYVGGYGEHATTFQGTISGSGGTVVAGDSVTGPNGTGTVKTISGSAIGIEILTGTFAATDSITNGTWVRTLATKTTKTLIEEVPDLVDAVETQVRWQWKIMTDPGYKTAEQGRTDRFTPAELKVSFTFLPEVRLALDKYKNRLPIE